MHGEQLTEDILIVIEEAVAKGANTNKEIADCLGWTQRKFESWKHGQRVDGDEESARICDAIKRGQNRQSQNLLRLAENALAKLIVGHHEEETKTEVSDTKGTTVTTTKKYYPPNPTIAMFTAVNHSNGKWQSINNKETTNVFNVEALPKGVELEIEEE